MVSIRQIFQKSRTYAALTVLLSMYMVGYMRHILVVNFRHANNYNAEIVYVSENISWLQEFIKNYQLNYSAANEGIIHFVFILYHLLGGLIFFNRDGKFYSITYLLIYLGLMFIGFGLYSASILTDIQWMNLAGREIILLLQRSYIFAFVYVATLITK